MKEIVHAACPHDCPDACGVLITVEEGRATRIQGDPQHPVTRGFLCAKVAKYLDRVYSPDRVLYPLRRIAPKGPAAKAAPSYEDGSARLKPCPDTRRRTSPEAAITAGIFERISWDEALEEICGRLRKISAEFGPEAILPYSYGGTLGTLGNASMDRRFFHRLGASQLARTICSKAGGEGLISVLGAKYGTEPEQFRKARTILAWGANIHGNNIHLWPFVEEARRQGGKLIVIDPYRTRTAACADWYLPINPGTDVALALGMMHVIVGEGLHDAEYVARHTTGFEELKKRLREYPPEQVAQWTGIAAEDIRKLARQYATERPAAIRLNYGVQRCDNGGMAVRAIAMLPCITGSWKEEGGGLHLSTSGAFPLDAAALQRPDLMERSPAGRATRVVNMSELGRVLEELNDPPVKALFVYNSNPAAVAPNHHRVVKGLRREDLFTVVHEQFLTDTTDYADVVLPATTFFEHKDLQAAYGHFYLQISQPAIAPQGEARSNVEMFRELARRMGFTEACFGEPVDEMIEAALAGGHKWLEGIDRKALEERGHMRLNFGEGPFLPFAEGGFATPSGKAELYSETLAGQGLDPVASFVAPVESRQRAGRYPLELLARKADNFLNSSFSNLPSVQKMEEPGLLEMAAADAAARGIGEGDPVRVYNERGSLTLRARVNGGVQPGVVAAQLHWAKLSEQGINVNVLTSERLTDLGAGPTFYSVLVEVERVAGLLPTVSPKAGDKGGPPTKAE
jgi:anaerobic selenocysteine-containing dehydrogenase